MWDKKIILAPLAGFTDTVFRQICKKFGADILVSEMVSADGILHNGRNTMELLHFEKTERPFGVQLFGANPNSLYTASQKINDLVHPDFIDLNAGCPVNKVTRKNGGSALLKNLKLFEKIVSAMVKSVNIPVTVKLRSGWTTDEWVDIQFAKVAQQCGANAITLHPRSRGMGFSGHSYWERITIVKENIQIPVIGNGDICSPEDADKMIKETNCNSIMVGRAAIGNPWIFNSIKQFLSTGTYDNISTTTRINTALEHLKSYGSAYNEKRTASEMKRHLVKYIKNLPMASSMRSSIFSTKSSQELYNILNQYLLENKI